MSQAEVAVLVVDASYGFEAAIKTGEIREHLFLAHAFGVKHLVVFVNKMENSQVEYSEKRFQPNRKKDTRHCNEGRL